MIELINEGIQLIHIGKDTKVNADLVKHALISARASQNYAKFYTDRVYITVSFHKDNTIAISHNIRNLNFYREFCLVQKRVKNKTDLQVYSSFIAKWLNIMRNPMYR